MKSINLLMLVGQSPQVITETLFCISKKYKKIGVNNLVIITTCKCVDSIKELFLSDVFKKLKEEFFCFNDNILNPVIHIIKKDNYMPSDIYNSSDNVIASDFINDVVKSLSKDDSNDLYMSISGGRKTLGIYASFALSLYGRENDKLFHVLVSKEYEQNRDFYFPYSDDEYIKSELELSEIPFVRLNNFLKDTNTLSYEDAVSKVQKKIEPLKLIIDLDNKKIFINENIVCMPPLLFCFYVYFAILKKEGNGKINWQTIEINQIIKLYEKLYNKQLEKNNFDDISYFLEKKSRINKIIKQEILKDNDIFLIKINGKRPSSTYEIGIEKQNIIIKGGL